MVFGYYNGKILIVLSLFLVLTFSGPMASDQLYIYSMCLKGCGLLHLPGSCLHEIERYFHCLHSCAFWFY